MEIEFKLSCTPETASVLGRQLSRLTGSPPQKLKLQNTYYDTPQQDLRAAGIALRIRQQDRQRLQTVKCAGQVSGGLSSRPEWETPYAGRFDFTPVSDEATRTTLETLARLPGYQAMLDTNFSRHVWHWRPEADTHVEIVLDRGQILAGGRQEAICELELELIAGKPERLLDLVAHLGSLAPVFPAPLSKATRGSLLLTGTDKPILAQPPAAEDASAAFQLLAQTCLDHISINLPANCARFTAENLHQVRVNLRRLRALLELFQPLLRKHWCLRDIRAGARAHMRALAPSRTQQILLDTIVRPGVDGLPARARQGLEKRLSAMLALSFGAARQHLLSHDFANWLLHTSLALHATPTRPRAQQRPWPQSGNQLMQVRLKPYLKLLRKTRLTPQSLHELRKASKHVRYQLEATGLTQLRKGKQAARRLARLQECLGQLNDLYSAADILNRQPASYASAIAAIGASHMEHHAKLLAEAPKHMQTLHHELHTLLRHLEESRA
jgi:inorganic triphosphatase YgiF